MMKHWYAKELSQLAGVSVRTLHHYDKIELLTPSVRQAHNQYRLYSEDDLLRLQHIIALKFFGFSLAQIKSFLAQDKNMGEHFAIQSRFLKEKSNALLKASKMLEKLSQHCKQSKSISWEKTQQLIEVFQMTQQLEHSWVKEIFNEEEIKQYAEFETKMKQGATSKADFEATWQGLVNDLNAMLSSDPSSKAGITMGERFIHWTNTLYGKEYAHLRTKKFEQGFAEGKGLDNTGLTQQSVEWLAKAMDAYWYDRLYKLLDKAGKLDHKAMLSQWQATMDDMYGNEQARKDALVDMALADEKVSDKAKAFLQSLKA